MPNLIVRPATKPEVQTITEWLLENSQNDPSMRKALSNPWQRWMFRHFVAPRYLRSSVYTWALEQDGQLMGYALVEPRLSVLNLLEVAIQPGADRAGFFAQVVRQAEQLAVEGDYGFIRTSPPDLGSETLALYRAAGFEQLDYYLYAYNGQVSGGQVPRDVTMRPLSGRRAVEQRRYYLKQELDASQVAGRNLIDAALLPSRPPANRAYEIELEGRAVGYFAPRPNERGDGVLTLVISLLPEYWGSDLEARIVAGMAASLGKGQPVPVRVLISTSAHCEKADAALAAIGLARSFDIRPVLYKRVPASPAA